MIILNRCCFFLLYRLNGILCFMLIDLNYEFFCDNVFVYRKGK